MTHQYKKLPVTMKMWTQFKVMPRTILRYSWTSRQSAWTIINRFSYQIYKNVWRWIITSIQSWTKPIVRSIVLSTSINSETDRQRERERRESKVCWLVHYCKLVMMDLDNRTPVIGIGTDRCWQYRQATSLTDIMTWHVSHCSGRGHWRH